MSFPMQGNRVYEVRVKYIQDDQLIANILHFELWDDKFDPLVGTMDSETVARAIADWWNLRVTPWQSLSMEAVELEVLLVARVRRKTKPDGSLGGPIVDYTYSDILQLSSQYNGVLEGEAMPSYVAVTVQKRATSEIDADYGSMRLAGLVEDHTTYPNMNEIVASLKSSVEAFALTLTQPLKVGEINTQDVFARFGVFSRMKAVDDPLVYNYLYPITDFRVNDVLGSQVSRKAKQPRF